MLIKINGEKHEVSANDQYFQNGLYIVRRDLVSERLGDLYNNDENIGKVAREEGIDYSLALVEPSGKQALVFDNATNATIQSVTEIYEENENSLIDRSVVDAGEIMRVGLDTQEIDRIVNLDKRYKFSQKHGVTEILKNVLTRDVSGVEQTINFAGIAHLADVVREIEEASQTMAHTENNKLRDNNKKHHAINGNYKKLFAPQKDDTRNYTTQKDTVTKSKFF